MTLRKILRIYAYLLATVAVILLTIITLELRSLYALAKTDINAVRAVRIVPSTDLEQMTDEIHGRTK